MSREHKFKVGIVGLEPDRGWARRAHVPALRALSDTFEIAGVANTSRESGERAAQANGIARAFADVSELVDAPEIDIVTITVRVPHHLDLVRKALAGGKHVYCEWPLGNGLGEAVQMAELAREKNKLGVIGTQAPLAPEIDYLRTLLAQGFVGDVLSSTVVAYGGPHYDGVVADEKNDAYLLDRKNGANMLTIPVGHTLAAIRSVLGDVADVSAVLATRRTKARVVGTGRWLPVTSPDQVLVSATLASGAPLSIHFRGGRPRDGHGFLWEVNGTAGDLRISGALGHPQMVALTLEGIVNGETAFRALEVPTSLREGFPVLVEAGNVARLYARVAHDLTEGMRTAPTFDDGVVLHGLIDAIERSMDRSSHFDYGVKQ